MNVLLEMTQNYSKKGLNTYPTQCEQQRINSSKTLPLTDRRIDGQTD